MTWYKEAVFYHIYPLGMLGAELENDYKVKEHRLNNLVPWLDHIKEIGCNAIYIGPLFESVGHGYETTDYKKLDSRLGTNEDLINFVRQAHKKDLKVIFDGVFNHTGRDFFAFKDILENRENSRYKDWYCNVNFFGNNEYNDGFSYDNWGGYNLMAKLNQRNPEVTDYICDVIRFWVSEFDVDGIRLDAADVLDFDFMKKLRWTAENVKEDFWLMGEVIHGDYTRWANESTLHSVTNYQLHKALFSGMNDHNFFEIAHTVNRLKDFNGISLYNFVDNHDVDRITTKLNNKAHYLPVHVMLYTLPGIPSVYYGSELGIEGKKYNWGPDTEIRPYINQEEYKDCLKNNRFAQISSLLGNLRKNNSILSYGSYYQVELQTGFYSYVRELDGNKILVCLSNQDTDHTFFFNDDKTYVSIFTGKEYSNNNGSIAVNLEANSAEVLVPKGLDFKKVKIKKEVKKEEKKEVKVETKKEVKTEVKKEEVREVKELKKKFNSNINKSYDEMSVEELQDTILSKMEKNGTPMTDQIIKSVRDNTHLGSLQNWVKSFH